MPDAERWIQVLPAPDLSLPALLIATVFGAGLVEPLRAGLAVTIAFPAIVLAARADQRGAALFALAAISAVGWWAANAWETHSGTEDDRRIVIDEVAGAVLGAMIARLHAIGNAALFAVAFLVADRWKPWPVSEAERLPGAWGVMADDLAIGVLLGLSVRLARHLR